MIPILQTRSYFSCLGITSFCVHCLKIPELSLRAAGDDWRRPRLSCLDNNTDTLWTLLFLAPN